MGPPWVCSFFVYNLVPMSSYFRRLRGDSSLLRLGLLVLDEGEKFEIDSEDIKSAFNLFRKPTWKNFFVFVRVPCAVHQVVTRTHGSM